MFRAKFASVLAASCLLAAAPAVAQSRADYPGKAWAPATTNLRAQWSNSKLADARAYSESIGSSAVMIVQHGEVVDEWGAVDRKQVAFSIRKSLMSALYGIYAASGTINIQETLQQLGVDDVPPLTEEEKQARLVDLLRARSGVYHAVPFETAGMAAARPARDSHRPGTFWYYNNWDFDTLGAVFEQQTHTTLGEAFAEKIAGPTQMQDYVAQDFFYLRGPQSVYPAFQVQISARDLARLGLLYLRHGRWKGRQIVPADWVWKSTHAHEMAMSGGHPVGGYEYLWWVQHGGVDLPNVDLPEGTYSARGAGGHYLLVIPALDLVIVHHAPNEPASHSLVDVTKAANAGTITDAQFGTLVKMILAARVKK